MLNDNTSSPFHEGEQALQLRLGSAVRDKMEAFGQRVIRDHLPDQHRDFYALLNYLLIGYLGDDKWPRVSLIWGDAGFLESPHDKQLVIHQLPGQFDPLLTHLQNAKFGQPIGVLGIDFLSRRRNRLSATLAEVTDNGWALDVRQSFGNCPKYIQAREWQIPEGIGCQLQDADIEHHEKLDDAAIQLIENADTFFIASAYIQDESAINQGVDVSHRGGLPGFVAVRENRLWILDFTGNKHFNTFGNLVKDARAGLLFIDFERGDLLFLQGEVTLHWEDELAVDVTGAERCWSFQVCKTERVKGVLPGRWILHEQSPHLAKTGVWHTLPNK